MIYVLRWGLTCFIYWASASLAEILLVLWGVVETQLNFPSHPKSVFFHKALALSLSINGSHFDVPFPVARLLLRHGELSLIHLYTMQLTQVLMLQRYPVSKGWRFFQGFSHRDNSELYWGAFSPCSYKRLKNRGEDKRHSLDPKTLPETSPEALSQWSQMKRESWRSHRPWGLKLTKQKHGSCDFLKQKAQELRLENQEPR